MHISRQRKDTGGEHRLDSSGFLSSNRGKTKTVIKDLRIAFNEPVSSQGLYMEMGEKANLLNALQGLSVMVRQTHKQQNTQTITIVKAYVKAWK